MTFLGLVSGPPLVPFCVVYGIPGGDAMSAQEMLAQLDRRRPSRRQARWPRGGEMVRLRSTQHRLQRVRIRRGGPRAHGVGYDPVMRRPLSLLALCVCAISLTAACVAGGSYEEADARMDVALQEADAEAYRQQGAADRAAAVERTKREAAQRAAQAAALRAAHAEALRRQREAAPDPDDIQGLFELGWSTGCRDIARTPRASGVLVSYEECMSLVERTDLDLAPHEAQAFGAYMAAVAMGERYGE
jgi:hypothetical protein